MSPYPTARRCRTQAHCTQYIYAQSQPGGGSGSGSTRIRIHLALLDPDPDAQSQPVLWIRIRIHLDPHSFGSLGSGSGSVLGIRIRIQKHGNWPNFTNNLVFCLSKRLLYLHPLKPMRIHNTDDNYFQIIQPGSTVVPSRFCTNGGSRVLPSLANAEAEGHIDKLREVEAGTILLSRLSGIHSSLSFRNV